MENDDLKFKLRRSEDKKELYGMTAIWLLGLVVLLALNLYFCMSAKADQPYFITETGQSYLRHKPGDDSGRENGRWYQTGWKYTIDEKSNTFGFGVGLKTRIGKLEISYHDLGEYNIFAGFAPSDEDYIRDGGPNGTNCRHECPPTIWGYGHGTAKGVRFSWAPEFKINKNWSVPARLGALKWKAKYEEHLAFSSQPHGREYQTYAPTGRNSGWSPVYGLGVSYKSWSLEYTRYTIINPVDAANTWAETVMVSYRVPL